MVVVKRLVGLDPALSICHGAMLMVVYAERDLAPPSRGDRSFAHTKRYVTSPHQSATKMLASTQSFLAERSIAGLVHAFLNPAAFVDCGPRYF
jgi:hypothetical protein